MSEKESDLPKVTQLDSDGSEPQPYYFSKDRLPIIQTTSYGGGVPEEKDGMYQN